MNDKTEILMSFAMANHGATFATWLRNELMLRYDLFDVRSVYVDSWVARSGETTHAERVGTGNNAVYVLPPDSSVARNVARVGPDNAPSRKHVMSETKAFPIGALRGDWNDSFKAAMAEAKVMIFAYTAEFADSVWCMKEWGQFHMENKHRRQENRPILKGIVLEFVKAQNIIGVNQENITRIPVIRCDGMSNGAAWDKNDFILDVADMGRLCDAISAILHGN